MSKLEIFCSYAHEDQALLNDLKTYLIPLQRQGLITLWADTDIDAGTEWEREIDTHLKTAHIILLLISPAFMASDYCYSKEMIEAMERHHRDEAKVIPVILRPIYWQQAPFGKLQAMPTGGKPVTGSTWHSTDEALFNVAEGIRKVVLDMQKKTQFNNLENASQATTPQPGQISREIEAKAMVPEKKLSKMSNAVKSAYIGAAAVIIAAIIGGIFLLHSITPKNTPTPTPTSAVTSTKTATPTRTSTIGPTPSPSAPVLTQPGTPFLVDSLARPDSQDKWDVINEPYASCGFSRGGYDIKVPANTVGGCSTNTSTTIFTNFIYEIKMTIVSGATNVTSNTRGAGLMFRYENQNGASNYGISFQQDGSYYMFVYKNQVLEPTPLGEGHCASFLQGANQTNLIDIEDTGSTIRLFVNNVYVMTATDHQFQSGYIGVQISSGADPTEVVFSDLKVWKL